MKWLCGDVGGTNARLAGYDGGLLHERVYASNNSASLADLVARWCAETASAPGGACLAIAGPVRDNVCVATNLPWVVNGAELTTRLGFPVWLVNDFYAAALGVTQLTEPDREQIGGGEPVVAAPIAVLGAGTGLGEATLLPGGVVVPGEGGHAEFGPSTAREARLAAWLIERYGRASWESVLSGPGLVNLSRFWLEERGDTPPPWMDSSDAPARITREFPEVTAWFGELYGTEAGNAALRVLARGGVYLCGGIAPALLPVLRAGRFRQRFEAKGKLSAAIAGVPVYIVTHPALGLLGAAAELQRRENE